MSNSSHLLHTRLMVCQGKYFLACLGGISNASVKTIVQSKTLIPEVE
ncbi:hypothetical protein GXM_03427 [Nostoc sphaeroides CCNUC1]|uniref:Uncharacterized protein n=1 Tax=Nostoc sphaeroides CCNUC1 TaxID=2653204 RepID=A0A5P8VZT0_9NOSO|nr:hypothetical protein GXM_03427 [Nostoc sphaeroides CCNUC1]